jgi:hypothetical protein
MKILFKILLFSGCISSIYFPHQAIAAYDQSGKSTITTNPKDPKYYDNNISSNKLISADPKVQQWAKDNPEKAAQIIEKNGGQCGNNCFNDMKSASTSNPAGDSTAPT